MPRTFVWHRTRGPRHTPKGELTAGMVRVEQVRSGIGHPAKLRRTLEALGLRHHQDSVVRQDSPALRGQIRQVRHLVRVTPIDPEAAAPAEGSRRGDGGDSPAGQDAARKTAVRKPRTAAGRKATGRKNNGE